MNYSLPAMLAMATAIAVVSLALSARQSFLGARIGTDHAIHSFIIRAIQSNKYRLFERIPRLLNTAVCAALPLYLHWIFAHLPTAVLFWAERLLNPAVNALHVLFFACLAFSAAGQMALDGTYVVLATALFAFTPQFYHALSARNFGLSARGIGLLLLSAFMLSAFGVEQESAAVIPWALLVFSGYLIWAFSTFGAQALVIVSILMATLTWRFIPVTGAALSLLLFMLIHPRYSLGYLRSTLRFIHSYATELAPIYVLNRRYSIWRDLILDIWVKMRTNRRAGLRYAYENSILLVVLLNPLLLLAVGLRLTGSTPESSLFFFAADVALCGAAAMLLTSLRKTRFLGEPERYAEAVTPWSTLAASAFVFTYFGEVPTAAIAGMFLLLAIVQLKASSMLARHISAKPVDLSAVEAAIRQSMAQPVRCCSNNEQFTKLLMINDWHFAYCIAVGVDYCGMRATEAFSIFPYLRREACERIVRTYRINVCVLDRSQYDSIFDIPPAGLREMRTIYENEGLRVLLLNWEDLAEPDTPLVQG